jgi:hypothetical protein
MREGWGDVMVQVSRIWFNLETGDYWFGTPPAGMRDRLTLFRASNVRSPMTIQHAARLLADSEAAMKTLSYTSGANEGRLHCALLDLAKGASTHDPPR